MSEQTQISLIPTPAQWQKIVEYETERIERDAAKDNGDDRPGGMRLSMGCPIRRVKALYDSWFDLPIAEGVAWRGHHMEAWGRAIILDGIEHTAQVPIVWDHGVSAYDAVLAEGTVFEWKSSVHTSKPSTEELAQTERMLTAGDRNLTHLWKLDPGAMIATGPYLVSVTDEKRDQYRRQFDGCGKLADAFASVDDPTSHEGWDNPEFWESFGIVCNCGGCEQFTKTDATGPLERLMFRYGLHVASAKEAADLAGASVTFKWREQGLRQNIIDALNLAAREYIEAGKKVVIQSWGDPSFNMSYSPTTERWTIKERAQLAERESVAV